MGCLVSSDAFPCGGKHMCISSPNRRHGSDPNVPDDTMTPEKRGNKDEENGVLASCNSTQRGTTCIDYRGAQVVTLGLTTSKVNVVCRFLDEALDVSDRNGGWYMPGNNDFAYRIRGADVVCENNNNAACSRIDSSFTAPEEPNLSVYQATELVATPPTGSLQMMRTSQSTSASIIRLDVPQTVVEPVDLNTRETFSPIETRYFIEEFQMQGGHVVE